MEPGDDSKWVTNLAVNFLGLLPLSKGNMFSSGIQTSWVKLLAESLEMLPWGIVLTLFVYYLVVFIYGIAADYACIKYSCFGAADISRFCCK